MRNKLITRKPRLIVEIIGTAGAGKTTLSQALGKRDSRIEIDYSISKFWKIFFLIGNTISLLPTFMLQYRQSRWFNWRETRSMVYLKAGIHVLGQKELDSDMITILDHGPIYRLAFLRELGPEITNSQIYKEWWRSLLNQWIAILDVIIWLDAPNPILLKRIRSREQKHSIKEECVQEAFKFLTHYRKFLKQIITDSLNNNRITMLHFDTNQISIEHMADKILGVFGPSFK